MRSCLSPILAVAVAATVTLSPSRAHAADNTCWYGVGGPLRWPDAFQSTIEVPVYVDISDAYGIQWAGGYNSYDFLYSVWVAMARWNEQSGAKIHLTFAGSVDVGRPQDTHPDGIYVYGANPIGPGNQYDCTNDWGHGLATDRDDDGFIDLGWVQIAGATPDCTVKTFDPDFLVEVLVHEFGHALGRNDAYANSCGQNHSTVMGQQLADLSLFDALEMQSVYGKRTTGSSRRRTLGNSGGAWAATQVLDATVRMSRPGPASSYRTGPLQMAWREVSSGVMRMARRNVPLSGSLGPVTTEIVAAASPISIAHAPDGSALMAYVKDSGQPGVAGQVCTRFSTNYGANYGAESCSGNAGRNGVGLAYDPLSLMFIVGYTNLDHRIAVRTVRSISTLMPTRSLTLTGRGGAEGVAIACADTTVSGSPNCRVVYASINTYGQRAAWFTLGVNMFNFTTGTENVSAFYSEHVPAVAWFDSRFHLAYSYLDKSIYHRDMTRTGTSWTYRSQPVATSATGWVSPPYLGTATECNGDICFSRLELIWQHYLN